LYIIIHQETSLSKYGLNTFHFIWIVAIVFAVLGYIFNVTESLCWAREAAYLKYKMESREGSEYLVDLIRTPPTITTHMECYHEEASKSYKVKTWTGEHTFSYLHWKDTSNARNLPKVTSTKPKMINLQSHINFANDATEKEFDHQKQEFIEENEHRDRSYRSTTTKEIDGLWKHILIYDSEQGLPPWMKMRYYYLSILCLCAWPFRILLGRSSDKEDFEIRKEVSIDLFPPDSDAEDIEFFHCSAIEPPSYYDVININQPPSYDEVYNITM
jgi:hypothetical protein